MRSTLFISFILLAFVGAFGCTTAITKVSNPYEDAPLEEISKFKKVRLPFEPGTSMLISQGAFGASTHEEMGSEYSWDFDVPLGTPVLAVQDGSVISIWEPNVGGGCDPKFANVAHNIKIEHSDGTIGQYVHINSIMKLGDAVKAGMVIGFTANNGFLCQPQLHFSVYKSERNLYDSADRQTLPLYFVGLPGGIARQGETFRIPN